MELHERISSQRGPVREQEPFAELKNKVHMSVISELGPQLFNVSVDPNELRDRVTADVRRLLNDEPGIAREEVGEPPERLGGLGLRSGDDDRDPLVDGPRNLAVGWDEDVGGPTENGLDDLDRRFQAKEPESAPQCEIYMRDGSIGSVHRADDAQLVR